MNGKELSEIMTDGELSGERLEERTLLGGFMSFEFSDCSITAAEVNSAVHDRFVSLYNSVGQTSCKGDGEKTFRFIENDVISEPHSVDARYVKECFLSFLDQSVHLAFVRKPNHSLDNSSRSKRRWLRMQDVSMATYDDPQLVAIFNSHVALPIAGFSKREDGRCSYIQLGTEMKDDNFYLVTSDEDTTRHEYVEALKSIATKDSDYPTQKTEKIEQLISQEVARNLDILKESIEHTAVKEFCHDFHKQLILPQNRAVSDFIVLGDDQYLLRNANCLEWDFMRTILEDGREVELVITSGASLNEKLISARNRKNILLPLVAIDAENYIFTFSGLDEEVLQSKRDEMVKKLSNLTFGRPIGDYPSGADKLDSNKRAAIKDFYKLYDVEQRLLNILGPTTEREEEFFNTIYNMSNESRTFSGVMKDVLMGKTKGDVTVTGTIDRENGSTYRITLAGRPTAMHDAVPRIFMTLDVDAADALMPQLNGTHQHLDEVLDILKALVPAK